jgi:hypothetical protein
MSTWILPQIFSRKIVRLIKEPTIPSFLGVFAPLREIFLCSARSSTKGRCGPGLILSYGFYQRTSS